MNSFIPKICQDCNNKQFGAIDCCTSPFINYPGFLITLPDINRILKNTCYKIEDFAKIIKVEGDDLKEDNDNYFKDLGFNNNFIYMHGVKKCPFKRREGCIIYKYRPMICRLFPFWFKKSSGDYEIIIEWGDNAKDEKCLICRKYHKSEDIDFLLSLIKENRESMKGYIRQFNEEIKLHKKLKYEIEKKGLKKVIDDFF